jgi:hypothetical protein
MEYEYTIGIEAIVGEEHIVDETSVDAKNEQEALMVAEELAKEFYPKADSISLKIVKVRPLTPEELNEIAP